MATLWIQSRGNVAMRAQVTYNPGPFGPKKRSGIEIRFEKRPELRVRMMLLEPGRSRFRLSRRQMMWYGYRNAEREAVVARLLALGDTIKPDDQPTTIGPHEKRDAKEPWELAVSFSDK